MFLRLILNRSDFKPIAEEYTLIMNKRKIKMKLFKNKWIMVFLILIIGLVSFLGICLLQDNDIVPVDLAVVE